MAELLDLHFGELLLFTLGDQHADGVSGQHAHGNEN